MYLGDEAQLPMAAPQAEAPSTKRPGEQAASSFEEYMLISRPAEYCKRCTTLAAVHAARRLDEAEEFGGLYFSLRFEVVVKSRRQTI